MLTACKQKLGVALWLQKFSTHFYLFIVMFKLLWHSRGT